MKNDSDVSDEMFLLKQLQKLIRNAERIRSELFQQFAAEISRKSLYLRPSVNRISLISCCRRTPQLGISVTPSTLALALKTISCPPKRPTPEKQLQSWLIHQAMESDGRLAVLESLLGGEYWFVSDEIALKSATGKKFVADILTVQVDSAGLASFVNIELKTQRLTKAFEQVITFRDVLEKPSLHAGWTKLAEALLGKKFQWSLSRELRGVVVWPALTEIAHRRPRKILDLRCEPYERVDVVGYIYDPESAKYSFITEELI